MKHIGRGTCIYYLSVSELLFDLLKCMKSTKQFVSPHFLCHKFAYCFKFSRYARLEVLSGFVNGLFLVVIAFAVFMTAMQRIYDPPTVSTEKLLVSMELISH